jgi:Ca2+-binding EF-hand superfamily protein
MLRILLSLLLIGSVPAAASAQGKSRTSGADAVLQQRDADHDGTLDLAEAKKAAAARFDALDRDHDGTLDRQELRGVLSAKGVREADTDKDKTIDNNEYNALVAKRFKAADKDHDGTLDRKELNSSAGKALLRLLQ